MNFVDSLNLFGVEAKEIPCIKGEGAPTTSTAGAVGMFYMNINNGDVYKCIFAADGVYLWADDITDLCEKIPSFGYMLSNTQSLLNISPSEKTVTVNDGYLFIKDIRDNFLTRFTRFTITKKTLNIDQTSEFALIVYDATQNQVICTKPNDTRNCKNRYIVAIIRRDYYTNPSANWIPGPYEVDGYLYNAPVPQAAYELIEAVEITEEGVSTVVFNHSLDKLILYVNCPIVSATVNCAIEVYKNDVLAGYAWLNSMAVKYSARVVCFEARNENGLVVCENTTPQNDIETKPNAAVNRNAWRVDGKGAFTRIRFFCSSGPALPVGSTFELWGVKA